MEYNKIPVNSTSLDSPLRTPATCQQNSFYYPINNIIWSKDNIDVNCGKNIKTSQVTNMKGPGNGYNWNKYLHYFHNGNAYASCDNGKRPILSFNFLEKNGNYTVNYDCPNDPSMDFVRTEDHVFKDINPSSYNGKNVSKNNNNFVNDWLMNSQDIYRCPANWYLSKIGGGTRREGDTYYNNYEWTCGTFYNEYSNSNNVFQWRYYNEGDILMEILTSINITGLESDSEIEEYINQHGPEINFKIVYNISKNRIDNVFYKDNGNEYIDYTNECYIKITDNFIEINFPLTSLSIIQFTFNKNTRINIQNELLSGKSLSTLPLCFTDMTIVQDTNLPKIYRILYDTSVNGGECNNSDEYIITRQEGTTISQHPNCFKLGHTATYFKDATTGEIINTDHVVNGHMTINPYFEANKYKIEFINDSDGYVNCTGTFETEASLTEILADDKIPICEGTEGVKFIGWISKDGNHAGKHKTEGEMKYYVNAEYPDYKLYFNVRDDATCKECPFPRTVNVRKEIGTLPVPALNGYRFDGWFYDIELTKPVAISDHLRKDTTIYGKFTPGLLNVYFIKPDYANIAGNVSYKQVANNSTITLPAATYDDLTFIGWFTIDNTDFVGTKWTNTTPVTNDLVLTAVFKDNNNNNIYKKYSEATLSTLPYETVTRPTVVVQTTPTVVQSAPTVVQSAPTVIPELTNRVPVVEVPTYETPTVTPVVTPVIPPVPAPEPPQTQPEPSIPVTTPVTTPAVPPHISQPEPSGPEYTQPVTPVVPPVTTPEPPHITQPEPTLPEYTQPEYTPVVPPVTTPITTPNYSVPVTTPEPSQTVPVTTPEQSVPGTYMPEQAVPETKNYSGVPITINIPKYYCSSDGDWRRTIVGDVARMRCPTGYRGRQSRICNDDGEWMEVDSSECVLVPVKCPADGEWPESGVGEEVFVKCKNIDGKYRKRVCGPEGVWGEEDKEDCDVKIKVKETSTIMKWLIWIIILILFIVLMWLLMRKGYGNFNLLSILETGVGETKKVAVDKSGGKFSKNRK